MFSNHIFLHLSKAILLTLVLFPTLSQAWWNSDWNYRKQLTLEGAQVNQGISGNPVLIRLHAGNFTYFLDVMEGGGDLRFIAGDDKTPLKFYVEKFDAVNEIALIWVNVSNVGSSPDANTVWMYYGNPATSPAEDPNGTYDVNQVLAYDFGSDPSSVRDVTAYGNHPAQFKAVVNPASLIGSGVSFDGQSLIDIPASPSTKILPSAGTTFSTWLKIDQPQDNSYLFHAQGSDRELAVVIDGTSLYAHFKAAPNQVYVTPKNANLTQGTWQHIALTAGPQGLNLYIDGNLASSAEASLQEIGGSMTIGSSVAGSNFLVGNADAIRISNLVRDASWLKFAASTQGSNAALVTYGGDEQNDGPSESSYFTIILDSVTVDGWAVIAILFVMFIISWIVMILKGVVISRVRKNNESFMGHFHKLRSERLDTLDRADSDTAGETAYPESSLYRIYHIGIQEVSNRLGSTVGAQAAGLSPQAVEAIRASLDAEMVRETQRLNSQMVLLTIAISGGPFLGLLGTVVGVMITFAAIAASGDVNVNAIAPGIAAALVATIAGLAVAIPALFGYNYLGSRIKDITADMRVFVDEYATRIAEAYGRD